MLKRYGEFYPFARVLTAEGEIAAVAAYTGDEHPPSQVVIDELVAALRGEAGEGRLRATGICFDARVLPPGGIDKTDAVAVRLEHVDGEAVQVFLPYRKKPFRRIVCGELFATAAAAQIFSVSA